MANWLDRAAGRSTSDRASKAVSDEAAKAPKKKGNGFFDSGPIGAARDVLGGAGNLTLKALDTLDMGRAAVVAGAQELGDGLDLAFGNERIKGGGRMVDTGFNLDDFKTNFNNRIGAGDVIEADNADLNPWAKRAFGFVGDVAADPLTYMTFGAATAGRGAASARLVNKNEVVRGLLDLDDAGKVAATGIEDVDEATRLVREMADNVAADSTGRLTSEAAKQLGMKVGAQFRGHTIPGTSGAADAVARASGHVKRFLNPLDRMSNPQTIAKWERVPGFRQIVAATNSPSKGIEYADAHYKAGMRAESWQQQQFAKFGKILGESEGADWNQVRNLIETGTVQSAPEGVERATAETVQTFLEDIRVEWNELTGRNLPKLEDYFPRQLTDAFREKLGERSGRMRRQATPLQPRQLVKSTELDKVKFLGEELVEGTVDEIQGIANRKLGTDSIQIYLDNPQAVFGGYITALTHDLRRSVFLKNLADVGILKHLDGLANIGDARRAKAAIEAADAKGRDKLAKLQKKAMKQGDRTAKLESKIDAKRAAILRADELMAEAEEALIALRNDIESLPPESAMGSDDVDGLTKLADEASDEVERLQREKAVAAGELSRQQDEIRRFDPTLVNEQITRLEADLKVAQDDLVAAQNAERVAVDPAARARAEAALDAAQDEYEKAAQKVKDVRRGKSTVEPPKVGSDEIDKIVDLDDGSDLVAAGPVAKAMFQKSRVDKASKALAEADPKWRDPKNAKVFKDMKRRMSDLGQLLNAKADGAIVPEKRLADLQAQVDKDLATIGNIEARFGIEPPNVTTPNPKVVDMGKEAQVALAQAVRSQAKKARDVAKAELRKLDKAVEKAAGPNNNTKRVVKKSTSNAIPTVTKRIAEIESALEIARRDKTVIDGLAEARKKAEKLLPKLKAERDKVQKKLVAAEAVEAEAWDTVNSLDTINRIATEDLVSVLGDEADKYTEQITTAVGRKKVLAEVQASYAKEAERLAKIASGEGIPTMAEVAKLEALHARSLAKETKLLRKLDNFELPPAPSEDTLRAIDDVIGGTMQRYLSTNNLWGDRDTIRAIDTLMEVQSTPRSHGKLVKTYDAMLSRWKAQALLSSGYHIRNAQTAIYMNWLANIDTGRYVQFERAWRTLQRAEKKGDLEAGFAKIKDPELRDAMRETWDQQGALFGMTGVEGTEEVMRLSGPKRGLLGGEEGSMARKLDPSSLEFLPYEMNFRMARQVEIRARGPLFIDGLMKGMSVDEAYERVMLHHFDYSDLSLMEHRYLKRLVPFYTWTRKNVPVMLNYAIRKPGGMMWYLHAKRNLEAGVPEDEVVPEYFGRGGAIRMPDIPLVNDNPDARRYAMLDLPFLNLNETFNTDQLLAQTTPFAKMPFEVAAGKQFFSGIPLRDSMSEAPGSWSWFMPLLKATSGFAGMPKIVEQDGRYFLSEKDAYKIEQMVPLLGRARRVLASETDSKGRYKERQFTSILSIGFGFGSSTNGERQQAGELYRRKLEMGKVMTRDKEIAKILAGEA